MYEFRSDAPVYRQITDDLRRLIAMGRKGPGEKIESIRTMAHFYGVNPNTVQRALAQLEGEGLLATRRTAGKIVSADASSLRGLRKNLASERIDSCLQDMEDLGYSIGETKDFIVSALKRRLEDMKAS